MTTPKDTVGMDEFDVAAREWSLTIGQAQTWTNGDVKLLAAHFREAVRPAVEHPADTATREVEEMFPRPAGETPIEPECAAPNADWSANNALRSAAIIVEDRAKQWAGEGDTGANQASIDTRAELMNAAMEIRSLVGHNCLTGHEWSDEVVLGRVEKTIGYHLLDEDAVDEIMETFRLWKITQVGVPIDAPDRRLPEADELAAEIARAEIHGKIFASAHEAQGVLDEELEEFWDWVMMKRKDRVASEMHKELIQLAAMAIKAIRSMENFVGGDV
jgi:hypothetical protein